ncbi:hypothetical protein HY643_04595 [Candidatus Woesearchaeota archaeon]|nr:hypothetical protein [Candidatus Woesearchaeota archaeon]
MIKNKTLTTLIAAALGAASLTGCATMIKNKYEGSVEQDNGIKVPRYNPKKDIMHKITLKCDEVDGGIQNGDFNKDGRYDSIIEVNYVDRNKDGIADIVHLIAYTDDTLSVKKWQSIFVDDNFDGPFDRLITDQDGDGHYDREL